MGETVTNLVSLSINCWLALLGSVNPLPQASFRFHSSELVRLLSQLTA